LPDQPPLPDNWTLALAASGLPNELSTDVKRTEWKWQQEKKRNRDSQSDVPSGGRIGLTAPIAHETPTNPANPATTAVINEPALR